MKLQCFFGIHCWIYDQLAASYGIWSRKCKHCGKVETENNR